MASYFFGLIASLFTQNSCFKEVAFDESEKYCLKVAQVLEAALTVPPVLSQLQQGKNASVTFFHFFRCRDFLGFLFKTMYISFEQNGLLLYI